MGYAETAAVAAVLSWITGTTLVASTDFAGWGQLLVGLAAVLSVLATLRNGRNIKKTEAKTDTVARTIGPENGKTLRQVLDEIVGFEAYQHTRNHDILADLAEVRIAMPLLVELAERLLEQLNDSGSLAKRLITLIDESEAL